MLFGEWVMQAVLPGQALPPPTLVCCCSDIKSLLLSLSILCSAGSVIPTLGSAPLQNGSRNRLSYLLIFCNFYQGFPLQLQNLHVWKLCSPLNPVSLTKTKFHNVLFGLWESPSLPTTPPPWDSKSFMEFNVVSPPLELHDASEITPSSSALSGWIYGAFKFWSAAIPHI